MKFKEPSTTQTINDIKSSAQYCFDENYIIWTAKTTPWRGRRVSALMVKYFNTKMKLLDIGSSQALTLSYTGQIFPRLTGLDIDFEAIKTAKSRMSRLGLKNKIIHYEGKVMPFPDNYFDGLVATDVFEHVDDQKFFISELNRILKKGSTLLIAMPNKLYPIECEFHLPFLSYLPKIIADFYVKVSRRGKNYNHINHPTYSKINKLLNKYFETNDITLEVIKNYQTYYLDRERGNVIIIVSKILVLLDKLENTFLAKIVGGIKISLLNLSAGWIFVCRKK